MRFSKTTALASLAAFALIAHGDVDPNGSVYTVMGSWTKNGSPLHFGNSVLIGDHICAVKPGKIVLSFHAGTITYSCDAEHGCNEEPSCKSGATEREIKRIQNWDRVDAAVRPVFRKEGDRLIAAVSRGTDIDEAVVALNGTQLDLSPMLNDLAPGAYDARLTPVYPSGLGSHAIQFRFEQGGPAIAAASGLRPGVYALELVDAHGNRLGMDAWVLVSTPDRFASWSDSLKQARESASVWSNDVDARWQRAFVRAYLEALAKSAL